MKNHRINYIVVGSFVIAMLAGGIVAIAVLSGRTGDTDRYYTRYQDVSGLKFGTKVLFMGFPVGQVQSIHPERNEEGFLVEISVTRGWQIPNGSTAEIRASGLLAAPTVDIRAGEGPGSLTPEGMIPGAERASAFAAMTQTANTIRSLTEEQVKPLVTNLAAYIDAFGAALAEDGGTLLANLREITAGLAVQVPEVVENFVAVSRDVRTASGQFQSLLKTQNVEKIDQVLGNVVVASANLATISANENIDRTLAHVAQAAENLENTTDRAGRRLDTLLSPEMVDKAGEVLGNVSHAAGNVARLTADLAGTQARLEDFIAALGTLVTDNRRDIDQSVDDLRHTLHTLARHIDVITYNLEGASQNMSEFSRQLRQNPGLLLGTRTPSDGNVDDTPR